MHDHGSTRREFVRMSTGVVSSGWMLLNTVGVSALAACAREAAENGAAFRTLTADEGGAMRALVARIIPSDEDLPGAEEAGAVYFIDGALTEWFPENLEAVRVGLSELESAAASRGGSFARLSTEVQDEVIREIEGTPFFGLARTLTILGVFSLPQYGGGRADVANRILGITHEPAWTPPFGEYDAEAGSRAGGGA